MASTGTAGAGFWACSPLADAGEDDTDEQRAGERVAIHSQSVKKYSEGVNDAGEA